MKVLEFLLVIVSIVLGLGIAELLAGFVRSLRGEEREDDVETAVNAPVQSARHRQTPA